MKVILRYIVEKPAVKGFRKAGGDSWESAMSMMHLLISTHSKEPEIVVWEDKNGIKYKNFSLFFKVKILKKSSWERITTVLKIHPVQMTMHRQLQFCLDWPV